MIHIYKKVSNSNETQHFLIPNRTIEKLKGIKAFTWMGKHDIIAFKAPCVLHTFGLNKTLYLTKFDENFVQTGSSTPVQPNSVVICLKTDCFVGETHQSLPNTPSNPDHLKCSSLEEKKRQRKGMRSRLAQMKIRIRFLSCLMFALSHLVAQHSYGKTSNSAIKLEVGASQEVVLNQAPRNLNISNPDVLNVQRVGLSNKILVTGLSAGESVLIAQFPNNTEKRWHFLVGTKTNHLVTKDRLSSASLIRTAREVQKRTGLEVMVDSGFITSFGRLSNDVQANAFVDICLGMQECMPRHSVSESTLGHIVERLTEHLKQMSYPHVNLATSLGGVLVSGTLPSEQEKQRIESLLESVLPKVFSQLTAERANQDLIETELSFFRVSETGLTALGLSTVSENAAMPTSGLMQLGVPLQTAKLKGGPVLNFAFPTVLLQALSKKGIIRQIAQPTLVVSSGGRGEITSGGELLFQSGGQVQKFLTQNYGITVALQPKLIGRDRIVHKVDLKITHPQADPTHNAVSSLNTSALSTEVTCAPNQHLLLTRIAQKASGKSITKVPILGHIPLLGELFKTRELSGEDAELWITIRSQVAVSNAPTLPELPDTQSINPNIHLLD